MGNYSGKEHRDIEQGADDSATEGDDILFATVTRLAARAMQQARTNQGAIALVSQIYDFADQIIEDYETRDPLADPVACRAGCFYCCCYEVVLTPVEALVLGDHVKKTFSEGELEGLIEKIDTIICRRDGKMIQERADVLHETPCIFLADGKCSVYEVRPFACRALHSLDDSTCRKTIMSRKRVAEFSGYTHRYYVFQTAKTALKEFFKKIGCQTEELTIARAMKHYLSSYLNPPPLVEDPERFY